MENNKYFESRYTFDKGRTKVWKAICKYLERYVSPSDTVIDFGAGYCDFINQIKAKNKIAIDINSESEKYCNKDVRFYSSINPLFENRETANIVFMSNLLEHIDTIQVEILLRRVYDLLEDNGRLILIQPNIYYAYREYWDDYTHIKAYSHISLTDMLRSLNYRVEVCKKRFLPLSMKSVFPKTYFLTLLYLLSPIKPFAKQMMIIAQK